MPSIKFKKLDSRAEIPVRAHHDDSGLDLKSVEDVTIERGYWKVVQTGLSVELPPGYEGQVRPRSGMAAKQGVTVLTAPGTVDCGYRGPVNVILINHGLAPAQIRVGDRIAQFVVQKVEFLEVEEAALLADTERGSGGFGSSGK